MQPGADGVHSASCPACFTSSHVRVKDRTVTAELSVCVHFKRADFNSDTCAMWATFDVPEGTR